jgi:hypothetical protein
LLPSDATLLSSRSWSCEFLTGLANVRLFDLTACGGGLAAVPGVLNALVTRQQIKPMLVTIPRRLTMNVDELTSVNCDALLSKTGSHSPKISGFCLQPVGRGAVVQRVRLRSSFLYLHMDNAKISLSKLCTGYFYVVINSYIF